MGLFDGYGSDSGGSSFGGLGGFGSGMNSFLSNPLVLASLQMISNNSPQINKIPNTFDNVAQVLASSTAAQRKNQEQDYSQNAISAALQQAGFSKEDAEKFKYNPAAANIVLDQLKQKKADEATRQYLQPDAESERPAPMSTPADPLAQQLKMNEQVAAPYKALAENTAAPLPQVKTPEDADKFVSGVNPNLPDGVRAALSKLTIESGSDWANHPLGEAIRAGDYAKAKELLPDYAARLNAKAEEPLPKEDVAEPQAQPLAPGGWLSGLPQQQAPAQQPQQQPAVQYGKPQVAQQTVPQYGTPQGTMQPMAQGGQPQAAPPQQTPAAPAELNVTQRALATREAARQADLAKQMKREEAFLANPNAAPGLKEVAKLRLQNLQKEMEATPDMREYRYYAEQTQAQNVANRKAGLPEAPLKPFDVYQTEKKHPLVNIDNKQESEYSKETGKELAKTNMEIVKDAQKARGKIASINQLESLLKAPNLYVGKGGTLTTEASAWAKAVLGVDVGNVPAAQAIQSISSQFALELRNPTGGAGMPGAMSDPDREFLMKMPPGLDKTPGGNALLADYMRRKEQRSLDVERQRQKYIKSIDPETGKPRGKLDEGFFVKLSDWADENPMFTDKDAKTVAAIANASPPSASPASARNGVVRWERGPDGKPRPVQ